MKTRETQDAIIVAAAAMLYEMEIFMATVQMLQTLAGNGASPRAMDDAWSYLETKAVHRSYHGYVMMVDYEGLREALIEYKRPAPPDEVDPEIPDLPEVPPL